MSPRHFWEKEYRSRTNGQSWDETKGPTVEGRDTTKSLGRDVEKIEF